MIGEIAMDAGRRMFLSTAEENFGTEYKSDFGRMLDLLANPVATGAFAPQPLVAQQPLVAPSSEAVETSQETVQPAAMVAEIEEPPEPARQPIELEVAVLREVRADGRVLVVPVEDGEVVRDGVGRAEEGDNLRVHFSANVDCYVYVVWVDATACATPLFPKGPDYTFENPIRAGVDYELPGDDRWFYLDDYRGAETLYLLASHEPMPEMADVLADLGRMKRSFRADLETPIALAGPDQVTRGIGGVRPGEFAQVAASDGSQQQVESKVFLAQFADSDLVITRWLWHE